MYGKVKVISIGEKFLPLLTYHPFSIFALSSSRKLSSTSSLPPPDMLMVVIGTCSIQTFNLLHVWVSTEAEKTIIVIFH